MKTEKKNNVIEKNLAKEDDSKDRYQNLLENYENQ